MVRQQQVDDNPIISSYTPRDNRKDLKCGRKNYTLFFLSQPLQTDRIILELFPCLIQMTSFVIASSLYPCDQCQQGSNKGIIPSSNKAKQKDQGKQMMINKRFTQKCKLLMLGARGILSSMYHKKTTDSM